MPSYPSLPETIPKEISRWVLSKYKSAASELVGDKNLKRLLDRFFFGADMGEAWWFATKNGWSLSQIQGLIHGGAQAIVNLRDPISKSDLLAGISYLKSVETDCRQLLEKLELSAVKSKFSSEILSELLDQPSLKSTIFENLEVLSCRAESKRVSLDNEIKKRMHSRSRKVNTSISLQIEFARKFAEQVLYYRKKPSYKFVGLVVGHVFEEAIDEETVRSWVKSKKL